MAPNIYNMRSTFHEESNDIYFGIINITFLYKFDQS